MVRFDGRAATLNKSNMVLLLRAFNIICLYIYIIIYIPLWFPSCSRLLRHLVQKYLDTLKTPRVSKLGSPIGHNAVLNFLECCQVVWALKTRASLNILQFRADWTVCTQTAITLSRLIGITNRKIPHKVDKQSFPSIYGSSSGSSWISTENSTKSADAQQLLQFSALWNLLEFYFLLFYFFSNIFALCTYKTLNQVNGLKIERTRHEYHD